MRKLAAVLICALSLFSASFSWVTPEVPADEPQGFWAQFKAAIESHLGRPYVWGSAGLRSFDCSGFVWRVMYDNGMLIKRTTARKLYMTLPAPSEDKQWSFGNIVFFDNLKHCGIVAGPKSFYHAESSIGTNQSAFDPYWRPKVCGVRSIAGLAKSDAPPRKNSP